MWRAVPARVSASGETSMPTRSGSILGDSVCQSAFIAREHRFATGSPGEALGVSNATLAQLARCVQRLLERLRERSGVLRVCPKGDPTRGLVQRCVRGHDRGRSAGHCFHDRQAEALETRWIREGGRAAVETRELVVADEAEQ